MTGSSGSCTGLAATATALANPRDINGVAFDGTANITVTAAAGTLTGATLNGTVLASSLTSVGTLLNLTVTNQITGSISGSAGSCTGNAATATALLNARNIGGVAFDGTANIVPATITVADTVSATCYVGLWEAATGAIGPKSDAALTYDATSGILTAAGFAGPLVGNVTGNVTGSAGSCIGNAATATLAGTVTVIDSTSATCWVGLYDAATGSLAPKTDGALLYNATTGVLAATIFDGPIGSGTATPAAGSFLSLIHI